MTKARRIWDLLQAGCSVMESAAQTQSNPRYVRVVQATFDPTKPERAAPKIVATYARCTPANGWTDERVDLLKQLWADGLTGSEIADRMGGGITRMSVIAKARRLGLASRPTRGGRSGPKKSKLKPGKPPKPTRVNYFAKRAAAIQSLELQPATPLPHVAEPVIPLAERKTILVKDARGRLHANDALTDACCKWGIGDPRDADFHFCGRAVHKSLPYCEAHSRRAFDLPQVRQRERAAAKERIPTFADAETV